MNNKKQRILLTVLLFCIGGVCVSAGVLVEQRRNQQKQLEAMEALAAQEALAAEKEAAEQAQKIQEISLALPGNLQVDVQPKMTPEEKINWYKETYGIEVPDKMPDFNTLVEETNPDIYAWLYIPNSKIDFPVLQHPTDNGFYLHHNLDGSEGYPACIYSENYNTKDFTDPVTVFYGHNMRNGSMFADLHLFEDARFFEENPYIYVYTPEDVLVYHIFSASVVSDEHLLYDKDYTNTFLFQQYLDNALESDTMTRNLREGVVPTTEDRLLVLSTCVTGKSDKRYLVQGVLLDEN